MCGIIGITKETEGFVKKDLLMALKRLEYRGYDSCGYAVNDGKFEKETGNVGEFLKNAKDAGFKTAICHTRWATHGGVTRINSHPHFNTEKTIFAVHNGIIENYTEMKSNLEQQGYKFISQTDSEIIPHYFDSKLKSGTGINQAIKDFFSDARGTYAVLLMRKGDGKLYAFKKDSPLVLGLCKGMTMIASDIYAFSNHTNRAIFFDDYDHAVIYPDRYEFYNNGHKTEKDITEFEWSKEEATKKEYPHFMIKEITEQPEVSARLISGLDTIQKDRLEKVAGMIKQADRIVFVACGTSYHASLVGAHLLGSMGYKVHAIVASEFDTFYRIDDKTLIIAVSQSGETMDIVTVLKDARNKGAKVVSIVNVPYSTIQRHSDASIEIQAGQEICVASTKAFTNQIIVMLGIAKELGCPISMDDIPSRISQTIEANQEKAKQIAEELYMKNDIFILGKGASYPMAREIALKLKEIPYMHAEGMMAGELKHGTLALIEPGTPVISLIPNMNSDMISSTKEVEARGARTIIISNTDGDFHVPKSDDTEFAIYSGIIGHLLSYYIGVKRGCEIDKPRNLAKSVTVH